MITIQKDLFLRSAQLSITSILLSPFLCFALAATLSLLRFCCHAFFASLLLTRFLHFAFPVMLSSLRFLLCLFLYFLTYFPSLWVPSVPSYFIAGLLCCLIKCRYTFIVCVFHRRHSQTCNTKKKRVFPSFSLCVLMTRTILQLHLYYMLLL